MKRKKSIIIIAIPILLVLIFALTYIPHKVVNIEASNVSKIIVFDGNTGYEMEITEEKKIEHIINNLNEVTFQKGKSSFGYMGYSFNTTIIDKKGKTIKELIINSNNTIRYRGFFYKSVDNPIDYDYIEELVRK
ncbi:hypothetical protein IMZ08_14270 [Bacillus luteolus]|uniref:Uncharacterized protein n=1 Tax=Litchfieldia luteola TaxID=682179 RepID=A0ABR9QL48_9BACI|nr:hypothetical protein [Cytobacillus luteolus]MBE4909228.1 hypothetical protein [Cytobacillus luteolus]MBP1940315.1 hypothetical protein [Cytobacillus luteolus]